MEDTLRVQGVSSHADDRPVLILILMEDTLRDEQDFKISISISCLNPYSNGRYSTSYSIEEVMVYRNLS